MNPRRFWSQSPDAVLIDLVQRFGPSWAAAWVVRPDARRYIRFLFVSALNTVFGYSVFAGLLYAGLHYSLAGLIATVLGVIFNFFTTGRLVFDSSDPRRIVFFAAMYAVMYGISLGELRVADLLGYNLYLASAALLLPNSLLGYVINKVFVFRAKA